MGRPASKPEGDAAPIAPLPATRRFVPIAYRVQDAADLIGLSTSRVWELIAAGQIRAKRLGGATVIRHDDLYAFVDSAPDSGPGASRKAAQ